MSGIGMMLVRFGFSAAFGLAGLYVAAAAKRLFDGQRDWIARGIVTTGEVTGLARDHPSSRSRFRTLYAPIVAFKDAQGNPRTFTSGRYRLNNPFTVGDRVAVRFLPDDPEKVDLDELTGMWWPFVAMVFMAAVALAIAALPLFLYPPAER